MVKVNGRTITDDYIIKVGTWAAAKKVVAKFEEMGYLFPASVEKNNCYYIAQSILFDDSGNTRKVVCWGRSEVEISDEFDKMQTYEEFMGEPEPEDKPIKVNLPKTSKKRIDEISDEDGWISIKNSEGNVIMDKLPKKKEIVNVHYSDGSIESNSHGCGVFSETFTREDGTVDVIWDDNTIGVTHWRQLPKPPKKW